MRSLNSKIVSIVLSFTFVLILATQLTALSGEPWEQPSLRWLEFDSPSKLEGLQLIGFKEDKSKELVLLRQFGTCNSNDCLKPDVLSEMKSVNLGCEDNLCLFFNHHDRRNPPRLGHIRLVAQFEGQSYQSAEILYVGNTGNINHVDSKKVTIVDNRLKISQNSQSKLEGLAQLRDRSVWGGLCLSLIIELTIWTLCLRRYKFEYTDIYTILPIVSIVHIISYLTICFVLPSLYYFGTEEGQSILLIWIGFLMLYICFLLVKVRSRKYTSTIVTVGSSILYWSLPCLAYNFWFQISREYHQIGGSLNSVGIIILAWLFPIVYGGLAIHANQRDVINFKLVMLVSAIANAASFVGIIICGSILAVNKLSIHIP
jgi:hypothetical protein